MLSPWRSHNPVRITKSHVTGKSFITLHPSLVKWVWTACDSNTFLKKRHKKLTCCRVSLPRLAFFFFFFAHADFSFLFLPMRILVPGYKLHSSKYKFMHPYRLYLCTWGYQYSMFPLHKSLQPRLQVWTQRYKSIELSFRACSYYQF